MEKVTSEVEVTSKESLERQLAFYTALDSQLIEAYVKATSSMINKVKESEE